MILATSKSFCAEGDRLAALTGNRDTSPFTPAQSIMRMAHSSSLTAARADRLSLMGSVAAYLPIRAWNLLRASWYLRFSMATFASTKSSVSKMYNVLNALAAC